MKSGFYWVQWEANGRWEPAEYGAEMGNWLRLGYDDCHRNAPDVIGDRIVRVGDPVYGAPDALLSFVPCEPNARPVAEVAAIEVKLRGLPRG